MAGRREDNNFYAVFQPSAFSQGAHSFVTKQYVGGPVPQGPSGYLSRDVGDYGDTNPFGSSNAMEDAAEKAVEYAAKNTTPITYAEVLKVIPPHANFWLAPTYNVHAYFVAAYWLAVGALLTGDSSLRQLAEENLSSGENRNYVFVQAAQGDVEAILDNAANNLNRFPQARPAYEAVKRLNDPSFRWSQEEKQWVQGPLGVAEGTATGSAEDVAKAAEVGRGLFTGEKPSGMSEWEWFFTRYKWTLIGVGVGTVALIAVGRPYAMAYYETVRTRREENARRGGSRSRRRDTDDRYTDYEDDDR